MSLFNILGIIAIIVVAIIGIALKIALRRWRIKIDGAHGYIEPEKIVESDPTDGWNEI